MFQKGIHCSIFNPGARSLRMENRPFNYVNNTESQVILLENFLDFLKVENQLVLAL